MSLLFIIILLMLVNQQCIFSVPVENNFNYCEGLKAGLNFYKAQRSGIIDPTSEFPWQRNNSSTYYDTYTGNLKSDDGSGYLSQGYFDAGDYLKITYPLAFSMTALSWSFIEFKDNIKTCGLTEGYLKTIKFGVDWLMAAHPEADVIYAQCGQVRDHDTWEQPSQIYNNKRARDCESFKVTKSTPSSDIAFEMVATMSAASIVFKEYDLDYSDVCKIHALELWNFGINNPGIQQNSMYSSNGYADEQVWASAWMSYIFPEESKYKQFYQGKFNSDKHFSYDWGVVYSWDNKLAAACIFVAKYFNEYINEANSVINRWNNGVAKTNDGIFFIDKWGNNRYALSGCLLEAIWNNGNKNAVAGNYQNFALKQMQIILGNNSNHHSYVSMFGFKDAKLTKNIHHRASHFSDSFSMYSPKDNQYPIVGALLPGPVDKQDTYYEDRVKYEMNEPTLDYNAVFVGVMASLINEQSKAVQFLLPPIVSTVPIRFQDSDEFLGNSIKLSIPIQLLLILSLLSLLLLINV